MMSPEALADNRPEVLGYLWGKYKSLPELYPSPARTLLRLRPYAELKSSGFVTGALV